MIRGKEYAHAVLHVHGRHNILNALAAASAAYVLGLPGSAVEEGLDGFHGANRRFERKGVYHGADLYDDYAHHPDELHALLDSVQGLGYRRIIVAFQPHTYSRTQSCLTALWRSCSGRTSPCWRRSTPPGRRTPSGISSADLCRNIPGSIYCSTLDKVTDQLAGAGTARRPDAHRGRRRHLPRGRKTAERKKNRMNLSPLCHNTRPEGTLLPQEAAAFDLLEELHIPYDRVSGDMPADTMDKCDAVSAVLGIPSARTFFCATGRKPSSICC
jgi:hypothetical protein